MASLYYDTLGNKAPNGPAGELQSGSGLVNSGDFLNLQAYVYWAGVEYGPDSSFAWYFDTRDGFQNDGFDKNNGLYALAVRDGDVLATPIPAAAWLMLSGIGVLGTAARRRKTK
jgi:hypothetical protein